MTKDNPSIKISVVIPVYNTALYIRQSMQSIIDQSLKEIEIIVINDGSTDDSLQIIKEVAATDSRIQVYSQKNQGQSVARNTGMSKAKGKYFYFMDSDDLLKPEALEKCYQVCEEKALDFVFFDADVLCEQGQSPLSWDYHRTTNFSEETVYQGTSLYREMLRTYTHRAAPWMLLIRSSYLVEKKLSFYPGIIQEDELFTSILYLEAERVGCLKENFAIHRVRQSSTMTNKYSLKNINGYLTVIGELLKYGKTKSADIQSIIDQYVRYTLNPVFQTAKSLAFKDKITTLRMCASRNYLKYVKLRNIAVMLLK